jgi:hypothetical protein
MDDERIKALTQDVLADLVRPAETGGPSSTELEARVAVLEAEVGALVRRGPGPAPAVTAVLLATARPAHPSFALLEPSAGGAHCVMEPDKPCVQSGACRTFGH